MPSVVSKCVVSLFALRGTVLQRKRRKKKPQQTTKTTGQIPAIRNNKTKVSGDVPVHGNAVRSFILAFYGYLLLWLVSRRNERYRTGCGQEESMGTSH